MPLIKYGQFLTYPDGNPAAGASFAVRLTGGNTLVPVFADKAGTVPLANPVETDQNGLLTFYAAPGSFYTDIAGSLFHYPVDAEEQDDAWPGTFVHVQDVPATVWTVAHHFGIEPEVTVLVSATVTPGTVAHTDTHTTTITFGNPVTGTALLRR